MADTLIDIVKREGRRPSESFQRDKLHASIYAACLSVRAHEGEAKKIADTITDLVITWCNTKPEVTSSDLRRVAARHLQSYHPDAAYVYEQHKLIL